MNTTLEQLAPHEIKLFRRGSSLCVAIDGRGQFGRITVVRAFPLSEPDRYWCLQSCDGQDLGIVSEPAALGPAARRLLVEELERRYFVPVIRTIRSVHERCGVLEWSVETDRGHRQFTTRPLREVILQPVPLRYIITDIHDNRYDVGNLNALDKKSQFLLMACL